jgi:hypothetical protein
MIKKDKKGYEVVSEKGKNLGSGYKTRAAALFQPHQNRIERAGHEFGFSSERVAVNAIGWALQPAR